MSRIRAHVVPSVAIITFLLFALPNAIQALDAQPIAGATSPITPLQRPPKGLFVSTLAYGSSGPEVAALQSILEWQGFYHSSVISRFGPATKAAVSAFQSANNLMPVGFVGPKTRVLLNGLLAEPGQSAASTTAATTSRASDFGAILESNLSIGMSGAVIVSLQQFLTSQNVYTGPTTGYYGPLTQAALLRLRAQQPAAIAIAAPVASAMNSTPTGATASSSSSGQAAFFSQTSLPTPIYSSGGGGGGSSGSVTAAPAVAPPVISGGLPSGVLTFNSTTTTLSVTTDKLASCQYSRTAGTSYGTGTVFSTTGGTSHTSVISGLTASTSYTYYVRCKNQGSDAVGGDYVISFSVAPAPIPDITGFFVGESSQSTLYNTSAWQQQFTMAKRVGADTILEDGYSLTQAGGTNVTLGATTTLSATSTIAKDSVFKLCVHGGVDCYTSSVQTLQTAHPDASIRRTFTWFTKTAPTATSTDHFIVCSDLEYKVSTTNYNYWALLFPVGNETGDPCTVPASKQYDLVIVGTPTAYDHIATMLATAQSNGINAYLPVPFTPATDDLTKDRDVTLGLTKRVVSDYMTRFSGYSAWVGFYEPHELALDHELATTPSDTSVGPLMTFYTSQVALLKSMVNKPVIVSPYWYSINPNYFSFISTRSNPVAVGQFYTATPSDITGAIKNLAATGFDVIAPQDGGGVGSVGRFTQSQANQVIEQRLWPTFCPGGGSCALTWSQIYNYSVQDFFAAARSGITQYNTNANLGSHGVKLWSNIEAFSPKPVSGLVCSSSRGGTTKAALDTAALLEYPYVDKTVSWALFYMPCQDYNSATLVNELAAEIGN